MDGVPIRHLKGAWPRSRLVGAHHWSHTAPFSTVFLVGLNRLFWMDVENHEAHFRPVFEVP